MENSFSLDFNPINTVKSVKDYEREINQLRTENFELKTRIAHSSSFPANNNISKVLYEQNEKFSQLESEKNQINAQLEELKNAYNGMKQENAYLKEKYTQDMAVSNEKIGLLEDENKRHILRMEKFSKEIQEIPRYKKEIEECEQANGNYKGFIENLESEIAQMKHEYNQKMNEYEINIRGVQEEYEKVKRKEFDYVNEIERLSKAIEFENNKNKSVIENLEIRIKNEIHEKEELMVMNKRHNEAMVKEGRQYMAGMEKFKKIVGGKLYGLRERMKKIKEMVERIGQKTSISNENILFLKRLSVDRMDFNGILEKIRGIMEDARNKINLYKNEIKETQYFMKNNKNLLNENVIKLLDEFRKQFNDAKEELAVCKKYLIKKAEENKLLKNENLRIIREIKMSNNVFKEKIVDPFSRPCIK